MKVKEKQKKKIEKKSRLCEQEQFVNRKKKKKMFSWIRNVKKHKIEFAIENKQISFVKQQSTQKSNKKTFKFWIFVVCESELYNLSLQSFNKLIILINLNKKD